MTWRCPYCRDVMARKFRRSHLRIEWTLLRPLAQNRWRDL